MEFHTYLVTLESHGHSSRHDVGDGNYRAWRDGVPHYSSNRGVTWSLLKTWCWWWKLFLCIIFQTPNNGFTYIIRKAPLFIAEQEIPQKTAGVGNREEKICQIMHKCSKISSSSSTEKFSMLAWFWQGLTEHSWARRDEVGHSSRHDVGDGKGRPY